MSFYRWNKDQVTTQPNWVVTNWYQSRNYCKDSESMISNTQSMNLQNQGNIVNNDFYSGMEKLQVMVSNLYRSHLTQMQIIENLQNQLESSSKIMKSMTSSVRVLTKIPREFPQFDGKHHMAWASKGDEYFEILSTIPDYSKATLASMYMTGEAKVWVNDFMDKSEDISWEELVEAVIQKFEVREVELLVTVPNTMGESGEVELLEKDVGSDEINQGLEVFDLDKVDHKLVDNGTAMINSDATVTQKNECNTDMISEPIGMQNVGLIMTILNNLEYQNVTPEFAKGNDGIDASKMVFEPTEMEATSESRGIPIGAAELQVVYEPYKNPGVLNEFLQHDQKATPLQLMVNKLKTMKLHVVIDRGKYTKPTTLQVYDKVRTKDVLVVIDRGKDEVLQQWGIKMGQNCGHDARLREINFKLILNLTAYHHYEPRRFRQWQGVSKYGGLRGRVLKSVGGLRIKIFQTMNQNYAFDARLKQGINAKGAIDTSHKLIINIYWQNVHPKVSFRGAKRKKKLQKKVLTIAQNQWKQKAINNISEQFFYQSYGRYLEFHVYVKNLQRLTLLLGYTAQLLCSRFLILLQGLLCSKHAWLKVSLFQNQFPFKFKLLKACSIMVGDALPENRTKRVIQIYYLDIPRMKEIPGNNFTDIQDSHKVQVIYLWKWAAKLPSISNYMAQDASQSSLLSLLKKKISSPSGTQTTWKVLIILYELATYSSFRSRTMLIAEILLLHKNTNAFSTSTKSECALETLAQHEEECAQGKEPSEIYKPYLLQFETSAPTTEIETLRTQGYKKVPDICRYQIKEYVGSLPHVMEFLHISARESGREILYTVIREKGTVINTNSPRKKRMDQRQKFTSELLTEFIESAAGEMLTDILEHTGRKIHVFSPESTANVVIRIIRVHRSNSDTWGQVSFEGRGNVTTLVMEVEVTGVGKGTPKIKRSEKEEIYQKTGKGDIWIELCLEGVCTGLKKISDHSIWAIC